MKSWCEWFLSALTKQLTVGLCVAVFDGLAEHVQIVGFCSALMITTCIGHVNCVSMSYGVVLCAVK